MARHLCMLQHPKVISTLSACWQKLVQPKTHPTRWSDTFASCSIHRSSPHCQLAGGTWCIERPTGQSWHDAIGGRSSHRSSRHCLFAESCAHAQVMIDSLTSALALAQQLGHADIVQFLDASSIQGPHAKSDERVTADRHAKVGNRWPCRFGKPRRTGLLLCLYAPNQSNMF